MTTINQDVWLSEQLGKPSYRINGSLNDLAVADLPQIEALVEARVDTSDSVGLFHLQDLGFSVIDCNLIFVGTTEVRRLTSGSVNSPARLRLAREGDEPGVCVLAREAFEQNRFHRDPLISSIVATKIKEVWARSYFTGVRGDWMVVAEDAQGIAGFLQLVRVESEVVIDLLAVAARSRRKGLARSMIGYALEKFIEQSSSLRVGTQLGNSASIQLYQVLGFRLSNASYILHKHTYA